MTTTMSALFDLPEPLDVVGMEAVSEAARSATVAQNKAGATRLEAAHVIVEQMARLAEESEEVDRARGGRGLPAYARLDPQSRARDHLAAACQLTCWHAGRLVTAGVQIHTRLPRLRQAVGRGLVPEQLAIDLACRLAGVPDASVAAVEREVVAGIVADVTGGDRPSRSAVESAVDRAVEQHDPGAAEDATREASRSRRVRFRPTRHGVAALWAPLPSGSAGRSISYAPTPWRHWRCTPRPVPPRWRPARTVSRWRSSRRCPSGACRARAWATPPRVGSRCGSVSSPPPPGACPTGWSSSTAPTAASNGCAAS